MQDLVTANKSMPELRVILAAAAGRVRYWQSSRRDSARRNAFSISQVRLVCVPLAVRTLASADEDRLIASLKKPVEDLLRTYGANIKEVAVASHAASTLVCHQRHSGPHTSVRSKDRVDFYNLQADLEESK
jgi:hypothetical protein